MQYLIATSTLFTLFNLTVLHIETTLVENAVEKFNLQQKVIDMLGIISGDTVVSRAKTRIATCERETGRVIYANRTTYIERPL